MHSLQSCYCTFFYEMDRKDMDVQAQKDARRQLEQDRKRRKEIEEERKLKLEREAQQKRDEKTRALEMQKAELRAILEHEKAQYKLLKEQGLVPELADEIAEDIETGRLPHETIKEAQLRHIRALSKLSASGYGEGKTAFLETYDDKMLEPDDTDQKEEEKKSSEPSIKSLKSSLHLRTEIDDLDSKMEAAMQSAMENMEGDTAVPPSEGEMKRDIKDNADSLNSTEPKESKSPWEDPDNYIVYDAEGDRDKSINIKEDLDDDATLDEVRVLWDIEIDDRKDEGGVGWTEVLVTRYRHDDSPHGSVFLSVDSSEETSLGWISLSAHDCKLKGVVDEDSHELYDCVNEGLLLDRRTAKVTTLPPIQEDADEVEAKSESRSNTMDVDRSKAEAPEENFDEDNEDESIAQQESQGSMSKLQRLQLQAREKMKASADEKIQKIKVGDESAHQNSDYSEAKAQEENFGEDNGQRKLQQLQEDARENIKASADEKVKKINTGDEGTLEEHDNEQNGSSINSDGENLQVEKIENDFDKNNGISKLKRLQLQARANIENSVENKLDKIDTGILEEVVESDVGHMTPYRSGLSQKEDDTPARLDASKSDQPDSIAVIEDAADSDIEEEVLE